MHASRLPAGYLLGTVVACLAFATLHFLARARLAAESTAPAPAASARA